jgi:hypothetical protein
MDATARYCLAHGLLTLHVRTEAEEQHLPAVLYQGAIGNEALRRAGPRVQRIARWDAAGWQTWWTLLARLAGNRPALAGLPPLEEPADLTSPFPSAHLVPPAVAVRAASPLPQGIALYLGAFAWEVAPFGPAGMEEPRLVPPGLEALYRAVVAEVFRRERRPLLPVEVPALLQQGFSPDVGTLVQGIEPALGTGPAVLGGEDGAVVAAVARVLEECGHEVSVVDPLAGLERLVWAAGGLP